MSNGEINDQANEAHGVESRLPQHIASKPLTVTSVVKCLVSKVLLTPLSRAFNPNHVDTTRVSLAECQILELLSQQGKQSSDELRTLFKLKGIERHAPASFARVMGRLCALKFAKAETIYDESLSRHIHHYSLTDAGSNMLENAIEFFAQQEVKENEEHPSN